MRQQNYTGPLFKAMSEEIIETMRSRFKNILNNLIKDNYYEIGLLKKNSNQPIPINEKLEKIIKNAKEIKINDFNIQVLGSSKIRRSENSKPFLTSSGLILKYSLGIEEKDYFFEEFSYLVYKYENLLTSENDFEINTILHKIFSYIQINYNSVGKDFLESQNERTIEFLQSPKGRESLIRLCKSLPVRYLARIYLYLIHLLPILNIQYDSPFVIDLVKSFIIYLRDYIKPKWIVILFKIINQFDFKILANDKFKLSILSSFMICVKRSLKSTERIYLDSIIHEFQIFASKVLQQDTFIYQKNYDLILMKPIFNLILQNYKDSKIAYSIFCKMDQ